MQDCVLRPGCCHVDVYAAFIQEESNNTVCGAHGCSEKGVILSAILCSNNSAHVRAPSLD